MKKSKNKNSESEVSEEAQRGLKKGNINFDLLEPEHPRIFFRGKETQKPPVAVKRQSKRGIFDFQDQRKPVNTGQILFWTLILILSVTLLCYIIIFADSLLWMLSLPLILISFLWSIIMLVLFKARPR